MCIHICICIVFVLNMLNTQRKFLMDWFILLIVGTGKSTDQASSLEIQAGFISYSLRKEFFLKRIFSVYTYPLTDWIMSTSIINCHFLEL